MKNKRVNKTVLLILAALLMLTMAVPIGLASENKKMLEAWYRNIKILSNGQQVYTDIEPFIVDGTTYVPARMMANIFNKDVGWDGENYIVSINDKPGQNISYLNMVIQMKDNEIKNLEKKIKELEEEKSKSTTPTNLSDLEDDLNYDHDRYKNVNFDIELGGTKTKITAVIWFSIKNDKTAWNKLTEKNIKDYLEDIAEDILEAFPKAGITGYFKDSSKTTSSKMYSFSITSKGKVTVDSKSTGKAADLWDLEDYLNDEYYDALTGFDVDIELDGDEYDIDFYVYMDYDKYYKKWDSLKDKVIQYFLEDIYWEIEDEFYDAYINGYIYDYDEKTKLAEYVRSGKSMKFKRLE